MYAIQADTMGMGKWADSENISYHCFHVTVINVDCGFSLFSLPRRDLCSSKIVFDDRPSILKLLMYAIQADTMGMGKWADSENISYHCFHVTVINVDCGFSLFSLPQR